MPTPDVSTYAQRFGLTVTPENVLGVRAIILEEAHGLQAALWQEERIVWLPKLGEDPVSKDMKRELNLATKALMDRAHAHIDSLFALGEELAATARAYGHTEEQIKASFGRTEVSGLSPLFKRVAGLNTASASRPASPWQNLIAGARA